MKDDGGMMRRYVEGTGEWTCFPQWRQEFMGEWMCPTKDEIELGRLAREYHETTERFDRTVCTGPIVNDSIRPNGIHEYRLISQNARHVYEMMIEKGARTGLSRRDVSKAISTYKWHHRPTFESIHT